MGKQQLSALATDLRIALGDLQRKLREQSQHADFTHSQRNVILRLDRDGPSTVTALANAEGVRQQSMGATVATLQTAGMIDGAPNPADGRQTILSLSPKCREMLRTLRSAKEDWLVRSIEKNFKPTDLEDLLTAVEVLRRLVNS
ncbi:MarR family winged helix-turn-helix transcriptional regulator [Granulicella paludicola]|uniref:MarR family winged helix-turn-helix transcriptional regulator n=1 Tax=Granulicella paludicola TaxID=474951 RepID=UPI0021E0BF4E|nr:MarR family winged helix-turn-helix transcriptional regulator [Granulicella paludicola]